jgi:hypothetical protein
MNQDEANDLARKLAWPGFRRTEEEIDALLGTLPNDQAFEMYLLIGEMRCEFEGECYCSFIERQVQNNVGWDETERLCKVIVFPFNKIGDAS